MDLVDAEVFLGVVHRQWRAVLACVVGAAILGLLYILATVPLYTSKFSVLIDRDNSQLVEQLSSIGATGDNEPWVLSQVELLRSETMALAVVDKLDLSNDPDFTETEGSLVSSLVRTLGSIANVSQWFVSEEATDEAALRRQMAGDTLLANLAVERVGRTYVLEISYASPSPELASKIANAIGEAYLVDKLNSRYDATRRAGDWLQDRIAELRQKALDSDLAVQKFRSANGLVAAGSTLVTDQQLSELNSALIMAQSNTAMARARLQRIEQIIASNQTDAIVTDVLSSSISNELRQKYLDASKRETEIAARLGESHVQAVRLRSEMAEYKRLMFEELNRIAESYRSDLEVAEAREKALSDRVSESSVVSASANETKVQLRELEREADSYRNLYQTFLQRYQEAVQQQSFPVTEARVISRALPARLPTYPRKALVIVLFCFLGALAGCGVAAVREFRDRFFRTGDQVRDVLGLEFLGNAPLVTGNQAVPLADIEDPHMVRKISAVSNYVIDHPFSAFAETLRSAKLSADLSLVGKPCKVIGIVSTLPGEGKSTIAVNFAELLASQGSRTILVDGDLRNPGATRALARHARAGLIEVLLEGADARSLLVRNPQTGLSFLPTIIRHRVPHSSDLLASSTMVGVLNSLSRDVDYIVVDLAPLGPVVDARAIASHIDAFVFVTEWGRTARRVVRQILSTETNVRSKCLGVILNKVDMTRMKLYRAYGSSEYYYSRYTDYYQEKA
ncbi:polysaccharide biosynthesis tyrosine autokinase [Rhizobium puerariae]|uniref:non-specific protein-tyrosine kinase n=1 Tax=Rhizobium puerariae TaxID=1585791 RepID=A0ABV6AI25_9HYPH